MQSGIHPLAGWYWLELTVRFYLQNKPYHIAGEPLMLISASKCRKTRQTQLQPVS